jgi:hypothetical protein
MIPPEPDDSDLQERLQRLLALEIHRITEDLSMREEWLVDTWNRHRDRGPFLDTLFSRYRTLSMTDLALLDPGALMSCEAFYRELEALRLYFRFTQDMPATLADRYRESLRRIRAYGQMALEALGGAPEQPVLEWPEGEEPPADAGELLATPQLAVVGSDEEETTDLDG